MKSISEILDECSRLTSPAAKIEHLRKHYNQPLVTVLKYALDPKIVWDLPDGAPPYTPCEALDLEARLHQEARKLYLFIKGGNDNVKPLRKETLFIQTLESIDKNDAKLLISIKDKKMPYKGITAKIVNEAFPGLLDER